ncbi:MAG: T9SS type A sorting domain-containing protein [Bacteroidota bacterium]
MKNVLKFVITILYIVTGNVNAQTLNQIIILPANPTPADTITIITNLTYTGNCTYGLAYTYTSVTGSTIQISPTYCGYWDSTACNSTDTFKVGPFANGTYQINMEFHQGSVCPISNFDATIYQMDTSIVIASANSISRLSESRKFPLVLYPNPATDHVVVGTTNLAGLNHYQVKVTNILGQEILETKITDTLLNLNTSNWGGPGIYLISVFDASNAVVCTRKLIVE